MISCDEELRYLGRALVEHQASQQALVDIDSSWRLVLAVRVDEFLRLMENAIRVHLWVQKGIRV
jgi:hypothetical protein